VKLAGMLTNAMAVVKRHNVLIFNLESGRTRTFERLAYAGEISRRWSAYAGQNWVSGAALPKWMAHVLAL